MFGKSKISQSMIDAVNSVVEGTVEEKKEETKEVYMLEESSEKVPTPTGMKVYGSSYGNSKKARQDQTKSSVDTLKGPKDKEVKEELKGNQHKIDANHNDKIDAQDFKILQGKKKVKEDQEMTFAQKLVERAKAKMQEKKDVVMPEAVTPTSPVKNQDVADKSYLKDKPGVKSDLKNLGRFLTGKKETNESVEELDEKAGYSAKAAKAGEDIGKPGKQFAKIAKSAGEKYGSEEKGKKVAGAILAKLRKEEADLEEQINEVLSKDASAGDWISDFTKSDNPKFAGKSKAKRKEMALAAYYAKQRNEETELAEKVIAGTDGWEKQEKDVKEKSGAVHTPMSRAKDLARSAFNKVQDKTKITK